MNYRCFFLVSIVVFMGLTLQAQDQSEKKKEKRRSFGPIIKIEPTALIHHYSKILVGIEYFISEEVSLQHHVGPILTVENYNLGTQDYDGFWGVALHNEVRYYFFNNWVRDWDRFEQAPDGTIKTGYFGMEVNYSYTNVRSNTILSFECETGDCSYYQQIDEEIGRNWLGSAFIVGGQFILNRKVSIDINGGLGLRLLWLDRASVVEDAVFDYEGLNISNEEKLFFYPSLSFNVGYSLY